MARKPTTAKRGASGKTARDAPRDRPHDDASPAGMGLTENPPESPEALTARAAGTEGQVQDDPASDTANPSGKQAHSGAGATPSDTESGSGTGRSKGSAEADAAGTPATDPARSEAGKAREHGTGLAAPEADQDMPESAETAEVETETRTPPGDAPASEPSAPPSPPSAEPHGAPRREWAGFFALLLGGLVAGGIGFGVRHYLDLGRVDATAIEQQLSALQSRTAATLAEHEERLAALEARLGEAAGPPDIAATETDIAQIHVTLGGLAERIVDVESQLSDLGARVSDLETRPLTEGASDAAIAAYEADLRKLQEAMAAQRAEIEAMMAKASEAKKQAQATAQAGLRRAALSRVLTALDAGGGYAAALADLEATGVDVPEVLARNAEKGVATLAELQAEFPDAARAALAAARDAALKSGEGEGWKAFLLKQLGARSLRPREGNDPDAILSRAEAAVREGRLTDALAEIDALPDVAKAELAAWAEKARQRLAAVHAAQALSDELN